MFSLGSWGCGRAGCGCCTFAATSAYALHTHVGCCGSPRLTPICQPPPPRASPPISCLERPLQELTGSKNIKLKPVVDADLVAGFVVEYGSTQIDLSGGCCWFVGAARTASFWICYGICCSAVVEYGSTQIDLSGGCCFLTKHL